MGVIIFGEKKTFLVCIFRFYNSESMTALPGYKETTKCKNHCGWIHWEQISQKCFCCFLKKTFSKERLSLVYSKDV